MLVRRPRQADLSKHISLEWKSLTDEEKAPYVRMSEEAKLVHARIYPGYKYQPRRKIEGASGAKKSSLRPDASKKHGKSKKSGKGNNAKKQDGPRCDTEADSKVPAELDDESQAVKDLATVTALTQLPSLGIELGADGEEESPCAGDPSKEWTWLPEQTLLPISWDQDQEFGTASDEVMQTLDANIEDGNEDEIEFGVSVILLCYLTIEFTYFLLETILSLVASRDA
jgi:HMG (high mobility group) box